MTVSTTSAVTVHVTNTSVIKYTYDFKIFYPSQLVATLVNNGVETELDQTTHYTVSGDGDDSGGYITLTPAGMALAGTGQKLALNRRMPFIQDIAFVTHSEMPAVIVERTADTATMERQEILAFLNRCIMGDVATTTAPTLPEFIHLRDSAVDAALDAINAAEEARDAASDVLALRQEVIDGITKVEEVAAHVEDLAGGLRQEIELAELDLRNNINDQLNTAISAIEALQDEVRETSSAMKSELQSEITNQLADAIVDVEAIRDNVKIISEGYLAQITDLRDQVLDILKNIEDTGLIILAATQAEVDEGLVTGKYVEPTTLNNWSQLGSLWTSFQGLSDGQAALWVNVNTNANNIALKADIASPAFTGRVTVPEPEWWKPSAQVATTNALGDVVFNHNTTIDAHLNIRSLIVPAANALESDASTDLPQDFNDYITAGVWSFGARPHTNGPSTYSGTTVAAGILRVTTAPAPGSETTRIVQEYMIWQKSIQQGVTWTRAYHDTWSQWFCSPAAIDVSSRISIVQPTASSPYTMPFFGYICATANSKGGDIVLNVDGLTLSSAYLSGAVYTLQSRILSPLLAQGAQIYISTQTGGTVSSIYSIPLYGY